MGFLHKIRKKGSNFLLRGKVMAKVLNLKWTNKFSGETGYVGKIAKSKGYFENAEKAEDARKFRSVKEAEKAIETLEELGEAENNTFEVVEA